MTETVLPWPHHRSPFSRGSGQWRKLLAEPLDHGQIVSTGLGVIPSRGKRVINDRCEWRRPDKMRSSTTSGVYDHRADADAVHRRRDHAAAPVTCDPDEPTFFSVRAARLAPVGGGTWSTPRQSGEKATFGQAATWCGFYGTRLGVTESIVLMDHPKNPWSPCKWFTRDYGFISPTPFNWLDDNGWRLPAGESIRVRYRVVVSKGPIVADEMNRIFKAWGES
jgi:hypothetical protein